MKLNPNKILTLKGSKAAAAPKVGEPAPPGGGF